MIGAALGGHVDERAHRHLPDGAVDRPQLAGISAMPWTDPSASLIRVADRLVHSRALAGPRPGRVDLQELARQGLALEEVRHLRLDALVAADDRGDRRGRCDGDRGASCAGRCVWMRARSSSQRASASGVDAPEVELQLALGGAGLGERRVRAAARQLAARHAARGSRCSCECASRQRAPPAQSKARRSLKNTSCSPITPRPTGRHACSRSRAGAIG